VPKEPPPPGTGRLVQRLQDSMEPPLTIKARMPRQPKEPPPPNVAKFKAAVMAQLLHEVDKVLADAPPLPTESAPPLPSTKPGMPTDGPLPFKAPPKVPFKGRPPKPTNRYEFCDPPPPPWKAKAKPPQKVCKKDTV
jgi:hypothetical protein